MSGLCQGVSGSEKFKPPLLGAIFRFFESKKFFQKRKMPVKNRFWEDFKNKLSLKKSCLETIGIFIERISRWKFQKIANADGPVSKRILNCRERGSTTPYVRVR